MIGLCLRSPSERVSLTFRDVIRPVDEISFIYVVFFDAAIPRDCVVRPKRIRAVWELELPGIVEGIL